MRRLITCLLAICCLVALAQAADWPRFLGPTADGKSAETGINKDWANKPPAMLWKIPLTDNGYAGPAVADGMVFIIDHRGAADVVRALELATGKDIWEYAYPDAVNNNYGFSRSTPAYDNGKLYTISRHGMVHCLNAKTGDKIWAVDMPRELGARWPSWEMSMSPVIDGDRLVLIPGAPNGLVAVVNKATGKLIWQGGGDDKPGYATPVLATINGVKQYVIFSATRLNGVSAADGKLLWSAEWRTPHDVNAAMPIVGENFVFITSNYRRGCALFEITAQGPVKRWENLNMHAHFSTPIAIDGLLYGNSDDSRLVCLDPWHDGKVLWEARGFEKGGVIALDGVLLAMCGNTGDLVMVRASPTSYQELGRIRPLGGQSWTAPVVADGKLLIRNTRMLACLDLK